jgi:hypothetical protein
LKSAIGTFFVGAHHAGEARTIGAEEGRKLASWAVLFHRTLGNRITVCIQTNLEAEIVLERLDNYRPDRYKTTCARPGERGPLTCSGGP